MIPRLSLCLVAALGFLAGGAAPRAGTLQPIDVSGFRSGAQHWRQIRDDRRFIQALPGQPSYEPAQVREIVANLLLFQRENGGWPKDCDMTAILTAEQTVAVRGTRGRADASFDNGNLHSQVSYLAHACAMEPEPGWRDACERGFDFILSAQYDNGGFPQRWPKPKGFHAHITFNDHVMIGILDVLQDAATGAPQWAWLDAGRRERAREAVQRGVDCILRCQIRVEGRLTGWCQQHDRENYEPRPARAFELASICPQETTEIVRFLMRLDDPGPAVVRAVDAAAGWLAAAKLSGIRVARVKAVKEEFLRHTADFDVEVVDDPQAPALWARHCEIGTNRPIFAGRDGVKKYALAGIERERRTGTPWYGTWPRKLLDTELPQWRRRTAATVPPGP